MALAVRKQIPVYVATEIMDFAGMDLAQDDDFAEDLEPRPESSLSEAELDEFRAFLDEIKPDDFS